MKQLKKERRGKGIVGQVGEYRKYGRKISGREYGMVKGNVEKYGERKRGIRNGNRKVEVLD
jgi:hypothetical protein